MSHVEFLAAYEAALALHRWEAVGSFIDDDACFVFSDGTHLGKPAIERAIGATFQRIEDETYCIGDIRWIDVAMDTPVCTYEFAWSGVIDGAASSGGGRGTSLLVKGHTAGKLSLSIWGRSAQAGLANPAISAGAACWVFNPAYGLSLRRSEGVNHRQSTGKYAPVLQVFAEELGAVGVQRGLHDDRVVPSDAVRRA